MMMVLLYKLESYGVRGILNMWFKSYLSQRTQYVSLAQTDRNNVILNRYSYLFRVNVHGVTQGLILGPLLFLLRINDLPRIFQRVNFVLRADDANILIADKEEEVLQCKIKFVMQQLWLWFCKNDLIVNVDKTCAISFHSHQNRYPSRPRIIFNNDEIAYSSELNFLGLFITENLAWHVQIHSFCANLSKIYYDLWSNL